MQVVADLHLHSKYSRAVSKDMVLETIASYARKKGINLLAAPDWTHPLWLKEMGNKLEEASDGLYKIKNQKSNLKNTSQNAKDEHEEPLFLLSTEIASIYSQGGKLRRIHNLVFAPSLEIAEKISKELVSRGCNLMSDGRPIIGLSSQNLLELILSIDKRCLLIPAHIWTPHFGVYGSASGFEYLSEAFGDLAGQIYGIETGLSSDPEMNWQVEELYNRSILSFSDAHSPAKMGREATVFLNQKSKIKSQKYKSKRKISYEDIRKAIKRDEDGDWKIGYTIEFYPEEGKYHFSGHRNCNVVFGPEDIRQKGTICPVCNRRLTEGVLLRVQQLSSAHMQDRLDQKQNEYHLRWFIDKKKHHPPYVKLVPLLEIIAQSLHSTVFSQKVKESFTNLVSSCESEINVLLKAPIEDIKRAVGEKVADGVSRVRSGDIVIAPGYDGEYGKVAIWNQEKEQGQPVAKDAPQLSLEL